MEPSSIKRPVTLRDIARATGVHFSTVSLVLSGSRKVSPKTRERVLKAAKRLKYRRDPVYHALAARRVRSQYSRPLIAFLTNRVTREDFEIAPHMPAFFAGAQTQAHAMGFACDLVLTGAPSFDREGFEEQLIQQGARGVILGAFLPELPQLRFDWSKYAVVKIDSWFMPPVVNRIGHDQAQTVRLAFKALYELGYRRVGMAVGQNDEDGGDALYLSGYLLEQHLRGQIWTPPLHFHHGEPMSVCASKLKKWIRTHRLDAVICNWGNIHALLTHAGFDVPGDIACVSLCLNQPDPFFAGTITPHFKVGQKAVEMIALLIKNQQFGEPPAPTCMYVAPEWHHGPSAPKRC